MELVNTLREQNCFEYNVVSELVQMTAPFAPHFAEECWERLGYDGSVFDSAWPAFDPALTVADDVTLVVQINGKVRCNVTVGRDANEADARAAAERDDAVQRHLAGKAVRKTIYVPNRLINFVA